MAQKARIEEYADGNVTIYNLRNNLGVPVFGLNEMISASRVTQYWDGTPMDESKVDNKLYLQLKSLPDDTNPDLEKYIGDYFKINLPYDGELFLEKDTIGQVNNMSPVEISLLRMGYYKGVMLNGYYEYGDTPFPIEYRLSVTVEDDDGGSVIELPIGIKLTHLFIDKANIKHFGAKGDRTSESSGSINRCSKYCEKNNITLDWGQGEFNISNTVYLRSSSIASGRSVLYVNDNPEFGLYINESEDGSYLSEQTMVLPKVVNTSYIVGEGWASVQGTTGVRFRNGLHNLLFLDQIQGFDLGFELIGTDGRGCSYNTIYNKYLNSSKVNCRFISENGWANENRFVGGRIGTATQEINGGQVLRALVYNSGNNYSSVPTLSFNGGGFTTRAEGEAIVENGKIVGVNITNPGEGYTSAPNIQIIGGGGSGGQLTAVLAYEGSRHIELISNELTGLETNSNKFEGVSLEGNSIEWNVYSDGGYNYFDLCRWEGTRPRIHLNKKIGPNSGSKHYIRNGLFAERLLIHETNGATNNTVERNHFGKSTKVSEIAQSLVSDSNNDVIRVYNSAKNPHESLLSDTDYRFALSQSKLWGKQVSDLNPRIWLNFNTGAVHWGNGVLGINEMPYMRLGGSAVTLGVRPLNIEEGTLLLKGEQVNSRSSILVGNKTPEGNVVAELSSLYLYRTATESGWFVKRTNAPSNTGWVSLITSETVATESIKGLVNQLANVSGISTADATDEATAVILVNEIKTKFNSLLTDAKDKGLMSGD